MTDVKITNVSGYCHIKITGHAGYGMKNNLPEGQDIVCAAISIVGQMAVQKMIEMSEEGKVTIQELIIKSGEIDIKAIVKYPYRRDMDAVIDTIKTGFRLIKESYGEYISVSWDISDTKKVQKEKGVNDRENVVC